MSADAATRREIPDATVRTAAGVPARADRLRGARDPRASPPKELATAAGVRYHPAAQGPEPPGLLREMRGRRVRGRPPGRGDLSRSRPEPGTGPSRSSGWATSAVPSPHTPGSRSVGFHVAASVRATTRPSVGAVSVMFVISPMSDLRRLIRSRKIAHRRHHHAGSVGTAGLRTRWPPPGSAPSINFAPRRADRPARVNVRRVDLSTELHVGWPSVRCRSNPSTSPGGSPGESARHRACPTAPAPIALLEACRGRAHRRARRAPGSRASDAGRASRSLLSTCNPPRGVCGARSPSTVRSPRSARRSRDADAAVDRAELYRHLYVHFEGPRRRPRVLGGGPASTRMAVGEGAGPRPAARTRLRAGQRAGTVGESLNSLLQQATSGRQAHAQRETAIDNRQPLTRLRAGLGRGRARAR
jgi:hypothetical protein